MGHHAAGAVLVLTQDSVAEGLPWFDDAWAKARVGWRFVVTGLDACVRGEVMRYHSTFPGQPPSE